MEEDIKRTLSAHRAEAASNTLEKLGRFLSMPIDRATLLPLEYSEKQLGQGKTGNLILDVLMFILMALIRGR